MIRLDRYLGEVDTAFLAANHITHLDCYILPKLHTIRLASSVLKNYEIPVDLENLWAYLKRGYETESFRKSCPSDQVFFFSIKSLEIFSKNDFSLLIKVFY